MTRIAMVRIVCKIQSITGIATAPGMESAKPSLVPRTINDKSQDDDDEPLTQDAARIFKTCVGKAMYISHHSPDIQHSASTLPDP